MHLLAQQSGAQRRGAFRDFHPIQTDPTHPTYSFWPFQPVHTEAFNQSVAVCGIGTLAWPTVHSLHFFFLEILLEICSKHLPHFSIFNFSQCCYFPFPRNQLDPSCQRFSLVIFLLFWLSPILHSWGISSFLLFSFDAPQNMFPSIPKSWPNERGRRKTFLFMLFVFRFLAW